MLDGLGFLCNSIRGTIGRIISFLQKNKKKEGQQTKFTHCFIAYVNLSGEVFFVKKNSVFAENFGIVKRV